MKIALIIDTRSRELSTYTASVTAVRGADAEDQPIGLVLRKGLELEKFPLGPVEMPIILIGNGYQAQSSMGFVAVDGCPALESVVVGGIGIRRGVECLSGTRFPIKARIFPAGTVLERVASHGNLNADTAEAAYAGVGLLAKNNLVETFLVEGQSNYISVFRLRWAEKARGSSEKAVAKATLERFDIIDKVVADLKETPSEHREDIFAPVKILERALRGVEESEANQLAIAMAVACGKWPAAWVGSEVGASLDGIFYKMQEEANSLVSTKKAEGWRFVLDGTGLIVSGPAKEEAYLQLGYVWDAKKMEGVLEVVEVPSVSEERLVIE